MENLKFDKELTALLVIDPYNDFISEGGKVWGRSKTVAEANNCTSHMLQVLNAARKAELRLFYALHRRYRPGDYETWKYIAPSGRQPGCTRPSNTARGVARFRSKFKPHPGEIVALEHWGSSGFQHGFGFAAHQRRDQRDRRRQTCYECGLTGPGAESSS